MRRFLIWLFALECLGSMIEATIFAKNDTYPSLTAYFGRILDNDKDYVARLQFLKENPFLCDPIDLNNTSFIPPVASGASNNSTDSGNNSTTANDLPVVLLANRGICSFAEKAWNAQIFPQVDFLIVANDNRDGLDEIVRIVANENAPDTHLALLSVTHRTGQSLKRYILEQDDQVKGIGGPVLILNTKLPDDLVSVAGLQTLLLSALALFFFMLSASACILLCAGLYGHITGNYTMRTNGGVTSTLGQMMGPRLLTEDQVRRLKERMDELEAREKNAPETSSAGRLPTFDSAVDADDTSSSIVEEAEQCAVCIDDLNHDSNSEDIIKLPCDHSYHTECIMSWLTERQPHCPLCKFNVLEYVQLEEQREQAEASSSLGSGGYDADSNYYQHTGGSGFSSLFLWLRRRRWAAVDANESPTNVRVTRTIAPHEFEDVMAGSELELSARAF